MDAVDHEVEVWMLAILVGDDERLVVGESERTENPVGDMLHGGAIDPITRIEADR